MRNIISDYKVNGNHIEKAFILGICRVGNYIYYSNMPKIIKIPLKLIMEIVRKIFSVLLSKVEIPFRCKIGRGIRLMHPNGIIINEDAEIGEYCTLFHQVTIGSNEHSTDLGGAKIGNNVYIGAGAKIIGNINIEDNCRIGANAVVIRNLAQNSTVVCEIRTIIK